MTYNNKTMKAGSTSRALMAKIEVCGTKVRSELKLGNVNVRPAVSVKLTASHNVVSPGQEQTKQTLWVA